MADSKHCKYCNHDHPLTSEFWYRLESYPTCKSYKLKRYNPAHKAAYNKQYRIENRDRLRITDREYRKKKREQYKNYMSKYNRDRERIDIEYKLGRRIRSRVGNVLRRHKEFKSNSSIECLGCSVTEFQTYIQNQFRDGMTWDNYGSYWHLDHILPLANYQLSDTGTFKRLTHYTNYQPLLVSENLNKMNKEDGVLASSYQSTVVL